MCRMQGVRRDLWPALSCTAAFRFHPLGSPGGSRERRRGRGDAGWGQGVGGQGVLLRNAQRLSDGSLPSL
jgi:hypothetical protein